MSRLGRKPTFEKIELKAANTSKAGVLGYAQVNLIRTGNSQPAVAVSLD